MKKFRPADIYYFLPIFLLGLSYAPNIVGWRIGVTLIASLILALPLCNYFIARFKELNQSAHAFLATDLLFFAFLGLLMVLGAQINYFFVIATLTFIFINAANNLLFANSRIKVLLSLLTGMCFISAIYLGLNQYNFAMLFREELAGYFLMGAVLFAFLVKMVYDYEIILHGSTNKSLNQHYMQLGSLYRLVVISFILMLWHSFPDKYVFAFMVLQLPVLYSYFLFHKSTLVGNRGLLKIKFEVYRQITIMSFIIFLGYLFLDSTQVLQAVLGGY